MDFQHIIAEHLARYPRMTPQDLGKLAYQSEFGPAHLLPSEDEARRAILREWEGVPTGRQQPPEDIGGGLCRFHLNDIEEKALGAEILVKLFSLTAKGRSGSRDGLEEKLDLLAQRSVPGMGEWLEEYRGAGCPALRHSPQFRGEYDPRYRLLRTSYASFFPALLEVAKLLRGQNPCVIAIDGRCGSGKSTLAALMEEIFPCRVFHMDDFYLPQGERRADWLSIPGGNMDLERFKIEVLTPALAGERVDYRPYRCSDGTFAPARPVPPAPLTIIEGSYSHHPALGEGYDRKLFLTCDKEEQLRRLQEREGDYFPTFARVWMPLEEQYIRQCDIGTGDALICTTHF